MQFQTYEQFSLSVLSTFFTYELFLNDDVLCRENLLNELMRETDEVLIRRQRIQETLEVLEQAHRVFTVSSLFIFLSFLQCFNICIF